MWSKAKEKWVKSLHLKKFRELEQCFLVEGHKLVQELLGSNLTLRALIATPAFFQKAGRIPEKGYPVYEIAAFEMEKISSLKTPSDVMAVVEIPNYADIDPSSWPRKKIVIDRIQDPGNLGTIIRTADWFGFDTIFLRSDTVEPWNPKTVQSTMGSLFRVKLVWIDDLNEFKTKTNGPWMGADLNGTSLNEFSFPESGVLFIGKEGSGLDSEIIPLLDSHIFIPGKGGAESLNASVAAGILMNAWK